MQLNVPPDLELLINKRLSSGGYTDAEDVLRRALEAQDAEESWTDEERRAMSAHTEENPDAADHVEQAIYDACAFIAEAPLTWPFPHGPYKSFASFLDVNPLS